MQETGERGRLASLDGLRGIAALVVVVCHTLLLVPSLAAAYDPTSPVLHGWAWLLARTPLHLLWAGGEAVFVFFVLSGFVLTLPFLRDRAPGWGSYYPRRLIRLYVPVWAALAFALVVMAVVPRVTDGNWWVNAQAVHPTTWSLIFDGTLAWPSDLDGPLWSLKWEVAFSLLLPLYLATARGLRRMGLWSLLAPVALVAAGSATDSKALTYLPMFAVGVLMAANLAELRALAARIAGWPLAVGSLLLLVGKWWLPLGAAGVPVALVGAAGVVLLCLTWRPAQRVGEHRVTQWLGKRSFSLYLTHMPILLACAVLPGVLPVVAIPLSLAFAAVFYRAVERPAQRLARLRSSRRPADSTPVSTATAATLAA